ncbi:flagellar hook assembly protein FlgD [Ralstonia soli]|uniref:Basal-body rod modification protein FlgD n=1 Tax=Ralstonia soli TaxID=2953896 RepID=A0ABT1APE7_9RALS|nr:flagellar hook assembly protein FlgD [Ralstonia soli]MCO5400315.1 flagellar hook assembly protein FlgD [Ralstonia soli]
MTISSTTGATSTAAAASPGGMSSQSGADLQNTFMTLLVTQLKNQDPLNPMDNSQMTAQLAQINTVSGIQQLNTTMSNMALQSAASQGAALIGRTVAAPASNLTLASGAANFGISAPSGADDAVLTITNAAGVAVRTVDLGALPAGTSNFTWNGKDDKGNALADGQYAMSVSAKLAGKTAAASTLATTTVTGVTINNGTTQLQLATGGSAPLSSITTIQ